MTLQILSKVKKWKKHLQKLEIQRGLRPPKAPIEVTRGAAPPPEPPEPHQDYDPVYEVKSSFHLPIPST